MNPPANWYPDPTGRHGQRYWDGEQWTEHVFTDGVQGVDPLEAAAPAASDQDGRAAHAQDTDTATTTADGGLFADAGQATTDQGDAGPTGGQPEQGAAPAEESQATGEDVTWSPDEQPAAAGDDEAVAPEVEPQDVVGTLDEVAEADGREQDADAATTEVTPDDVVPADEVAAPDEEVPVEEGAGAATATAADAEDTDTEGAEAAPDDDFSDAFMVTPETVSRLVSRQASSQPQPTEDEAEAGDTAPQAAAPPDEDAGTDQPPEPAADGGVIDAPPPTAPAAAPSAAAGSGLGISGDLVGGAFAERDEGGPVALQNARLLRCSLGEGPGVIARQGTMVAYQGEVEFERQGAGGVTRALKRAATGEGLAMMRAEGTGDVFFADGGQHVFLLELDGGPGLSVNGRNVLAFSAALQWDIERVKGATLLAGGLFNTTLTGTGWVALVSDGEPVVLRTDEASTHVDVNALVAWSGGLSTSITNTVTAKSLVGLGSGEAFQMAFDGAGIVIVQPSEGPMGGAAAT